jgi:hypothetical protein
MEESLRLYSTIMTFVGQTGLVFNDVRNLATFVWALVGLLMSKESHLSQWLLYRTSEAKAASKERQLSRWLHNRKIEPNKVYRNLISAALIEWQSETIEIALDTSVLWERFVLVRLSAIYRGRALPLGWLVLTQSSASVSFSAYAELVRTVACLLPPHCRVVLLADRGFVDVQLMQLAVELGWHFTLRAKSNLWVYRAFRQRCKMRRLMPPPGEIHLIEVAQVTEQRFGPIALALGHVRTKNGYEHWALITDRPPTLDTFDEYGRRFAIEENFLDDKSAGFQLESSQLDDADALSRLCLILAAATLYLVSTGTAITTMNLRPLVDTHWQRGLSYFQIGWRWLHFALAHAQKLLSFLWLEPGPDPEPVFASKRRSFTLAFSAIFLFDD